MTRKLLEISVFFSSFLRDIFPEIEEVFGWRNSADSPATKIPRNSLIATFLLEIFHFNFWLIFRSKIHEIFASFQFISKLSSSSLENAARKFSTFRDDNHPRENLFATRYFEFPSAAVGSWRTTEVNRRRTNEWKISAACDSIFAENENSAALSEARENEKAENRERKLQWKSWLSIARTLSKNQLFLQFHFNFCYKVA